MTTLVDILSVDSNPRFDPGFETELNGNKYKYVYSNGGVGAGSGVTLGPIGIGVYPAVQPTAIAPPFDSIFGISVTPPGPLGYRFVQIGGLSYVFVNDPTITLNDFLQGGNAGNLVRLVSTTIQQRSVKVLTVPAGGVGTSLVYIF